MSEDVNEPGEPGEANEASEAIEADEAVDSDETICAICANPIAGEEPIPCKGCEAQFHRGCRISRGHCPTDGCKRSKPLEEGADVAFNRSVLSVDVMPWIYGFLGALIVGTPIAGVAGLGLIGWVSIVIVLTLVIGGVKSSIS